MNIGAALFKKKNSKTRKISFNKTRHMIYDVENINLLVKIILFMVPILEVSDSKFTR